MTTELATIQGELVEPLSEGKAKNLDRRIRLVGAQLGNEMDKLVALLTEAMQGQIHVALGFSSWPAYVKDAVDIVPADRTERKALATFLSGKGASNRAIAAVVGVDEGTIRGDLKGAENSATEIIGLDGKEYKRKPKPKNDNSIIDAEVVDDPEPEERKPVDVVEDFGAEVDNLLINVQAFKDILTVDAELFPKARKRCAQRFLNRMQGAISDLTGVVDALMESGD